MVYDISVDGIGVVGYMYPSSHGSGEWEYDIILRPYSYSVSDRARSFADAQIDVVSYLCQTIPYTIKFPALPESKKIIFALLQKSLG